MKTLFPDIDRAAVTRKLAARRERRQRATVTLAANPGHERFVLEQLATRPKVDATMAMDMSAICLPEIPAATGAEMRDYLRPLVTHAYTVLAMWQLGILWREPLPWHPSGEQCYLYWIRGGKA